MGSSTFRICLFGFALAAAIVALAAGGASASARLPQLVRSERVATRSPCADPLKTRFTYAWPVRPFHRQHPVRGGFGDPRTLTTEDFGETSRRDPGLFSFHIGIDIVARVGAPVYPVVSGIVHVVSSDELVVFSQGGRRFQYWHLINSVRNGQRVTAYRTILGRIRTEAGHVHLTEIDGKRAHNPLDPGHLEPYHDHTAPEVGALIFRSTRGTKLPPAHLTGTVQIAASAYDIPPLPVPGAWHGFPLTPALVAWQMTSAKVSVVPQTTVADFRHTEPLPQNFWRVYAAGTYQNFPVFAHHYFFQYPGRYFFNLTPRPLDTLTFPNGRYTIRVEVADTCGNRGTLKEQIRITNPRLAHYPPHTKS